MDAVCHFTVYAMKKYGKGKAGMAPKKATDRVAYHWGVVIEQVVCACVCVFHMNIYAAAR